MTISELIERLEALKAEHGDLPIRAWDEVNGWVVPELQTDLIPLLKGSKAYVPAYTVGP